VDAAELVLGSKPELLAAERRRCAGQDARGMRLAAAGAVTEPGVADIEAQHRFAHPGVDAEQRVGERVRAHVEAAVPQHRDRVDLADE
jgi:hypothetical protein